MDGPNRRAGDFGSVNLITIREAAAYLRIHEMTLYRHIKKGHVPYLKLGGQYRFDQKKLREWVVSRMEREEKAVA